MTAPRPHLVVGRWMYLALNASRSAAARDITYAILPPHLERHLLPGEATGVTTSSLRGWVPRVGFVGSIGESGAMYLFPPLSARRLRLLTLFFVFFLPLSASADEGLHKTRFRVRNPRDLTTNIFSIPLSAGCPVVFVLHRGQRSLARRLTPIFPCYLTWHGMGSPSPSHPLRFASTLSRGTVGHPCSNLRPWSPGWDPMSFRVTSKPGGAAASGAGVSLLQVPSTNPGRYLGYSRWGLRASASDVRASSPQAALQRMGRATRFRWAPPDWTERGRGPLC